MLKKLAKSTCKRFAIVAGLTLITPVSIADTSQLDVESGLESVPVIMQRVVVPPPSGPYASRLGMPSHVKRFNHRMMAPANRSFSVNSQPAGNMTAPITGSANYGAYRPETPQRAEVTSQPVPATVYRNRGYAPAYYPGPPRGYGYPPARPPGYGYAPPPGYTTRWGRPVSGQVKQ